MDQAEQHSELEHYKERYASLKERVRTLSVELRAKNKLLDILLESVPMGVILFSAERRVLHINRAAEQMLRINRAYLIGRACDEIFNCHGEYGCCPVLEHEQILDRVDTVPASNDEDTILMRSANLTREEDRPIVVEAFIDVTEGRRARKKIEAASRAKDSFMAKISHELRTPLNAIIGYSDLLMECGDELSSAEIAHDVDLIKHSGLDLLDQVNRLLEYSRFQSNEVSIDKIEFNVSEVIEPACQQLAAALQARGNSLISEIDMRNARVITDPQRLQQVLACLLDNANKFTHHGTVTLRATRETRDSGDWLLVSIADSGVGMETDKIEAIFKAFEQIDDTLTRSFQGWGLGLTIALQVVRRLGGDISVHSRLGEGSTFTLELPIS